MRSKQRNLAAYEALKICRKFFPWRVRESASGPFIRARVLKRMMDLQSLQSLPGSVVPVAASDLHEMGETLKKAWAGS